ncbi:MROH5 isoform 3 [Pan troglodytes]|uniref:MROH5 isoform 1 n=1 Tax=Pan troglodytes TaxID=9598 RepID=A0A2J8LFH6_PANTR|nr:MROH5 isoform 1 [Pan troglodytes]PNI46022.1 MROH5 isoform 3 [Pan troglodytes]
MDRQCSERPHSRTPMGRVSSAVSQNSSHLLQDAAGHEQC